MHNLGFQYIKTVKSFCLSRFLFFLPSSDISQLSTIYDRNVCHKFDLVPKSGSGFCGLRYAN